MQIVGYRTVDPALLVAESGRVERVPLERGSRLSYALGERHCAGVVRREGDDGAPVHDPCDAPEAPHCSAHTIPWAAANNADSDEEHAVYLAAFAPATFKVGVTRTWRLETRLREQGADRAAHVHTVSNGRVARNLESEIARRSGPDGSAIGDQVRVADKIEGLHRTVDERGWEALLAEFDPIDRYAFDYGFDLDRRPVSETLAAGTVVGGKGRVAVIERVDTAYAVDLRDLVGYEVEEGRESRALQSSLGRF